jgi:putative endonuclease
MHRGDPVSRGYPRKRGHDDGGLCVFTLSACIDLDNRNHSSLQPAGTDWNNPAMSGGWVYIMTNRPDGTLYVGVTNNIGRRVDEHRRGLGTFTRRYGLTRLVYMARFERMEEAIAFEKHLKHWTRARKVRLIQSDNPHWIDLFDTLNQ